MNRHKLEQRLVITEYDTLLKECVDALNSKDYKTMAAFFGDSISDDMNKRLSRFVFEYDDYAFVNVTKEYSSSRLSKMLYELYLSYGLFSEGHGLNTDWESLGQLTSKKWLVDTVKSLHVDIGTTYLLGGWYGTLATMLFDHQVPLTCIRSFDIDPTCEEIARSFNKPYVQDGWRFQAATCDIFDMNFVKHTYELRRHNGSLVQVSEIPETIINTSAEHMSPSWYNKVPENKLVIIQSNDFDEIDEHVNCVNSDSELAEQFPMSQLLYKGTHATERYNRFMVIGYK